MSSIMTCLGKHDSGKLSVPSISKEVLDLALDVISRFVGNQTNSLKSGAAGHANLKRSKFQLIIASF